MKFFCRILNYIFSLFFSRKRRLTYYGKWAVITGASDGIGKAVAQQLLKEGLSLIIIGRNKEKLSNVSDEVSFVNAFFAAYNNLFSFNRK